ncbi:hypothetical protein D7V88_26110 [Corallococcus terminator]|uniref:Uncharacterized protein n=2 Tax=Corallococcus terminator TaxID=2316733 RepID=A0A3A8ITM9_9BACT|nr:hypothetical protein D7V88_26110 [Corallococcus terminator]
MVSFEGAQAFDEIAKRWALHDGRIHSIVVSRAEGAEVAVEIDCRPRHESAVGQLRLRFEGVVRFDFAWSEENDFYVVSGYKAVVRPSGFYLSLDPYDDRDTAVDARDGSVVEARRVQADFMMKASS